MRTEAQLYSRVTSKLSELVPIKNIEVQKDDIRQLLILVVEEKTGVKIPARSLSDGTLRFLTLCILGEDPESEGLICMEEPENGIHPAKIPAMIDLLRRLAVDVDELLSKDNPMRQLIIATHSPLLVQLQNKDDILFAMEATVKGRTGEPASTLRCRPLSGTWRCGENEKGIGIGTILAYLTTPPGAQLSIMAFDL